MENEFFIKIAKLLGLANWIIGPPLIMYCIKNKSRFSISVIFILIFFMMAALLDELQSIPDDLEKPYIAYIASLFISTSFARPERPGGFCQIFSKHYLVLSAMSLFVFAFLMFV